MNRQGPNSPGAVDELRQRIASLEEEVVKERRAATRNGLVALALGAGFTGFEYYRRRVNAVRVAERFGLDDPLTGLKNRRYIAETVGADCDVITRQHRMAAAAGLHPPMNGDLLFMIVDIDSFKTITARHGHGEGDRVLSHVADALRSTCRTSDTVARWSGEQFLCVLRFTNRATAPLTAERLRVAVEQRTLEHGDGPAVGCTCSIGFAAYPVNPGRPDDYSWEQAVALAEDALRRAQQAGGNTWVGAGTAELATTR